MRASPGSAPTLLLALEARPRSERALSPDGEHWLTVGDLLDRVPAGRRAVRGAMRGTGPVTGRGGVVRVPGNDPVAAVEALLTAQAAGAVPVVGAPPGDEVTRAAASLPRRHPDVPAGGLLVVVTSGSGGRPRAVVRTATSWQASLAGYDTLLGEPEPPEGPPGVSWAPGPPSSTLTLFALWHALATGRPALATGPRHGDRDLAVAAAAGAAVVHCVPTVLADLLDARAAAGLPRLRHAVVAGAALPPRWRDRATALGIGVAEYYGAAELSFVAADAGRAGLTAFPGAEIMVRRGGEIWVRSPYLAIGYLTAEPGAPLRRDEDGWASVGDLGRLDDDGTLVVRGRGDGTATVGGATVILADVERALVDRPDVAELVALAEPDARFGERVLLVVRPEPGAGRPPEALVAALRTAARHALPPAARPVRYVVRSELPRTAGGKPARAALLRTVLADPARTLTS